jgi:hypothetical protein
MGVLVNLQKSFALSLFPSQFVAWIDAASAFIDSFSPGGGAQANIRYVSVLGNDATGDGSFVLPFLTIARAMTSITDADSVTKPYLVSVGPGIFPTAFTVKPGTHVVGQGKGPGEYNGSPLTALTVLAPNAAQVLDAGFAGAGNKAGSIQHCAISTPLLASFQAIGSTGAGAFYLENILTESAVSIIGAAASGINEAGIDDLHVNNTVDVTLTNLGGSTVTDIISDFGGGLFITQTGAGINSFHNLVGSLSGVLTATCTTGAGTSLNVNALGMTVAGLVVTGVETTVIAPGSSLEIGLPDAATRVAFGGDAASTVTLISGFNLIRMTPTANRVLTFGNAPAGLSLTEVTVVNKSTAFNIDLTFVVGALAPGNPTYVPPSSKARLIFDPTDGVAGTWSILPFVQSGVTTLVAGVSPAIPADITANSRITSTLKTFNGASGIIAAKSTDRVVGTRTGGGSFKLTSVLQAAGTTVVTDIGVYDWTVNNEGG